MGILTSIAQTLSFFPFRKHRLKLEHISDYTRIFNLYSSFANQLLKFPILKAEQLTLSLHLAAFRYYEKKLHVAFPKHTYPKEYEGIVDGAVARLHGAIKRNSERAASMSHFQGDIESIAFLEGDNFLLFHSKLSLLAMCINKILTEISDVDAARFNIEVPPHDVMTPEFLMEMMSLVSETAQYALAVLAKRAKTDTGVSTRKHCWDTGKPLSLAFSTEPQPKTLLLFSGCGASPESAAPSAPAKVIVPRLGLEKLGIQVISKKVP